MKGYHFCIEYGDPPSKTWGIIETDEEIKCEEDFDKELKPILEANNLIDKYYIVLSFSKVY